MARIEHDESEINLHSLRAKVFNHIQNDILNGVYKPGDSLTESKLCTELGVSRTPIREAIRQLELEGLVQSIPNKGVFVNGISTKDIEDIYTIRMLIEGLAARWAAENITQEELKELKETIDLEEFYTMKNDTEHLLKLDSKFHEIIFRTSKSRSLMHVLSMFHHYVQKARNASFGSPGRAMKVLDEHKAIFQAISDRDAERAERLTTEHVKNASVECQTAYKLLMEREGK
ncbi:GntR family transcriptional regulator [Acetivibrio cellulolyticus]|uniref:GntR family transcriptional regulator n=1 Tax=Acetivibrio cellulolyticus TaxID=35830 RepID=UPI0001E2FBFF|nr:GntR family transcriptional regulator [Acetivibrio cellulolyticus]